MWIGLDVQRTLTPNFFGQLAQIMPIALRTATADAQGAAEAVVAISPGLGRNAVLAQAAIFHPSGAVELANVVTAWMVAP